MRRRLVAAGAAVLVLAACGFGAWRLWRKSDDVLRPVVVMHGVDAGPLLSPSFVVRLAAATGRDAGPPGPAIRFVALTFDDGPYPVATPLLLQVLRSAGVPATFFLIGRDAEQYPDLTRAIAAAGHEIADHTLTHPNLDELSDADVTSELRGGADALERIAPDAAERRLFRPPHGRYTAATIRAAQAAGFDTILWNDDPGDWRVVPPAALRDHILSRASAPEIVLLHSGRQATVEVLPGVIAAYRAAGFRFVTVGELLRRVGPARLNRPVKHPLSAAAAT